MTGFAIPRHRAVGLMLAAATFLGTASSADRHAWQTRYEQARERYDLEAALDIRSRLSGALPVDPCGDCVRLYVETCLLVAELHRIDFEEREASDRAGRRTLGERIDEAADQGLAYLPQLSESSEKYRLEADLLGTKIRTKYQAKKYRKAMNAAIDRARELDPENVEALISAAKPHVFGKDRTTHYEKAVELLNEALTRGPGNERAHVLRGIAYERMGDIGMARKDWRTALGINPLSRPAKAALERSAG